MVVGTIYENVSLLAIEFVLDIAWEWYNNCYIYLDIAIIQGLKTRKQGQLEWMNKQ